MSDNHSYSGPITCKHCGKQLKPAPVAGWWSLADPDQFYEAAEADNGSILWCDGSDPGSPRHEPEQPADIEACGGMGGDFDG